MERKKTFTFEGREITIGATEYLNNGSLALILYTDSKDEDFEVITVNLNTSVQKAWSNTLIVSASYMEPGED